MKVHSSGAIAIMAVLVCFTSLATASGGEKHRRLHKFSEWLSTISEADRAKYRVAKKQAMLNPAIQAAHERRRKADAEYRGLLHAEMLKADPSVKPLLEKAEELQKHDDF